MIQTLTSRLGTNALALIDAITNSPRVVLNNIFTAFRGAFSDLYDKFSGTNLPPGASNPILDKIFEWFAGGTSINISQHSFTSVEGVTNFLLAYSGLTWDHLKDVIRTEIGAGNYAAIERIASITADLDANPVNMLGFLSSLPARFGSDLEPLVTNFWASLQTELMAAAKRQMLSMLMQIAPRILAKFDPTAGLIVSIYDGVSFVLNNQSQILEMYGAFVDGVGDLAASVSNPGSPQAVAKLNDFKGRIINAIENQGLPMILNFALQQLGLGGIREAVKNVINFIPARVDDLMRRAVREIVTRVMALPPFNGNSALYTGIIGPRQTVTYAGTDYTLWVTKPRTGSPQVKIAQGNNLVAVLTANMLNTSVRQDSRQNLTALTNAVRNIAGNLSPQQLATAAAALPFAALKADIEAGACTALNSCFAAGTKLWTPTGYRNIEELCAGDLVYARNENDPNGPIEAKVIEDQWERTGRILQIMLAGGKVISTTPEHPVFLQERGWTVAGISNLATRFAPTAAG